MKTNKILMLVFTLIFTLTLSTTFAQKKDKKTKKELKEYLKNPNDYKKKIKGYQDQIDGYDEEMAELDDDFQKAEYLRVLYYDSIQDLNFQISKLIANPNSGTSGKYSNVGIEFRVQIGAYRYFDFTHLLSLNEPIGYEKINGVIHYFLGSWDDPNLAYEFAVSLRKLKIKDAFVSKYVNGSRVYYDHVLEQGYAEAK